MVFMASAVQCDGHASSRLKSKFAKHREKNNLSRVCSVTKFHEDRSQIETVINRSSGADKEFPPELGDYISHLSEFFRIFRMFRSILLNLTCLISRDYIF